MGVNELFDVRLVKEKWQSEKIAVLCHVLFFLFICVSWAWVPRVEGKSPSYNVGAALSVILCLYGLNIAARAWLVSKNKFGIVQSQLVIFVDYLCLSFFLFLQNLYFGSDVVLALKAPLFTFYFLLMSINAVSFNSYHILASIVWGTVGWTLGAFALSSSSFASDASAYGRLLGGDRFLIGVEIEKLFALVMSGLALLLASSRSQKIFQSAADDLFQLVEEMKSQKEKLNNTLTELKDAHSAKSMFLTRISHELRTPINVLVGRLHLSQGHHPDVEKSAHALLEMVDNIITINEIKGVEIQQEEFDPILVAENVVSYFKGDLSPGVRLSVVFNLKGRKILVGHKMYLKRLLNVLLSNSVKYTEKGSIKLELLYEEQGHSLGVKVSDTGKGIPADILEKLASLDNIGSDSVSGLGLGLVTMKRIVDSLHGTYEVKSTRGRGSVFYIKIPAGWVHQEALPPEASQDHHYYKTLSNLKPLVNVLVVDDNQSNLIIAQAMLGKLGVKSETAVNGKEAIEKIRKNLNTEQEFECVLMDCMMPVMDGYDATEEIRDSISATLPVIALTSHALQKDRERAMNAGMNDHLTKPVNMQELDKVMLDAILKYRETGRRKAS